MSEMELATATATSSSRAEIAISLQNSGTGAAHRSAAFGVADLVSAICEEMARDGSTVGRRLTVVQPDLQLRARGNYTTFASTLRVLVRRALVTTAPDSEVRLAVHAIDDRVWIDIADHCGGIAAPASQLGALMPRSSIGERLKQMGCLVEPCVIEARGGSIDLYNIAGAGCVWSLSALRAV